MKHLKFILLCAVISAFGVSCTKSVYDEKQALEAQQGLLQFKYDQEIKLELLRQTGASALAQLQASFATRATLFSDSLSKANDVTYYNNLYNKRDITVKVLDLVSTKPVVGAVVTIPTSVGTVLTATSDSSGIAFFPAEKNGNVPNPASAMASKNGFASGSIIGTIAGNKQSGAVSTVYVWNQTSVPNTLNGVVYVENDLTNDQPELAKNAFVNVFTLINIKGFDQRIDWSVLTNSNGEYSFKLPDLSNNLQVAHSSYDGTIKMFVNGEVPGYDSVPKIMNVPASFYLGTAANINFQKNSSYAITSIETATNSLYSLPNGVSRFSAAAPADSNGRGHYLTSISFNRIVMNGSTESDSASASGFPFVLSAGTGSSAGYYSTNTTTMSTPYSSVYLAGTTIKDTVAGKFYDVIDNADGYWKSMPEIKFVLTQATNVFGNKYKYISEIIQTKGGRIAKVDPNVTYSTFMQNRVKALSSNNSTTFKDKIINEGFLQLGTFRRLTNGNTYTQNLSYGAGKLLTAVR